MKNLEQLYKNAVLNAELGPNLGYLRTTTKTTAGAVTYVPSEVFGGQINRDPNGSGRTDTLPTAALMVAYLRDLAGQCGAMLTYPLEITFYIQNDADAAETITIGVDTGGTISPGHTVTIAQSTTRKFSILFTVMTPGSEAYVLRNRGSITT